MNKSKLLEHLKWLLSEAECDERTADYRDDQYKAVGKQELLINLIDRIEDGHFDE